MDREAQGPKKLHGPAPAGHENPMDPVLDRGLERHARAGKASSEVEHLVRRIGQRKRHIRSRFERGGHGRGEALDLQAALDRKLVRHTNEACSAHHVPEDVVGPIEIGRQRRRQSCGKQPQMVAIARPQHHPMRTERDFLRVTVCCQMGDEQAGQRPGFPGCCGSWHGRSSRHPPSA